MTELEEVKEALGDAAGDFALILFDMEVEGGISDRVFGNAFALYKRLAKVRSILNDPLRAAKASLDNL